MILDKKAKRVVMLNPKTGTSSLVEMFHKYEHLRVSHEHTRLMEFKDMVKEEYLDYKVYSFYRNPVERFISGFNYSKIGGNVPNFTNYIAILYRNKQFPIFTKLHEPIEEFTKSIEDLSLSEFLNPEDPRVYECIADLHSSFILEKQYRFCDHPNVTLLDFGNYETNVRWLLEEFELDSSIDIPKVNSNDIELTTCPSIEDIEKIKHIYKSDYDFFKSVNILFN